jgi:hypothetical protein
MEGYIRKVLAEVVGELDSFLSGERLVTGSCGQSNNPSRSTKGRKFLETRAIISF